MPRVCKKAIRYRDLKAVWWFLPVIFFELFFLYTGNLVIKGIEPQIYSTKSVRTVIFLFAVSFTLVMMSKVLFGFERNREYYTFSASMPFTKKQILGSKLLTGIFIITAAFAVQYVVLNYILTKEGFWKQFIPEVSLRYASIYMMVMFVFAFIIMLNSANLWGLKENLVALFLSIVPITVLLVMYGRYSCYRYMSANKYFDFYFSMRNQGQNFFDNIFLNILNGVFFSFNPDPAAMSIGIVSDFNEENPDILTPIFISCGIYLVLIIALLYIACFFIKRNKYIGGCKMADSSLLKVVTRSVAALEAWIIIVVAAAIIQGLIKII